YFFILISILATTSRTAFLGVPILLAFDFVFLVAARLKAYRASKNAALLKPRRGLIVAILFFLIFSTLVPVLLSKNLRSYANFLVTRSIGNPTKEGSFVVRFIDMRMAMEIFVDHPWFGAGPGQAKKLFFAHPESYKVSGLLSRSETYEKSSGPIGNCLYTELLSEWGILGFTAYLCGIFFMFWRTGAAIQWRLWPILGLLYFTTGSLPRMDLWLYIALLWTLFHSDTGIFKDGSKTVPDAVQVK
ncbi:MAG: O-antigen ligase family protein, partial [Spirochaetia bacterium]|nr:O-antigen ligase family protein [Spirochaetia bacterium]